MSDRRLRTALRDLAVDAADLLNAAIDAGAELPFVVEEQGARTVLYQYAPLTGDFIAAHWPAVRGLDSYGPAERALAPVAATYLRLRGLPGDGAEPALRDLLERLHEGSTSFRFSDERFEATYAELERTRGESAASASVVAPVHGLRSDLDRVELEPGLALVSAESFDAPPEAVEPPGELDFGSGVGVVAGAATPTVLCVFEGGLEANAVFPLPEARARFRRLLTGLRLAGGTAAAIGPLAWARAGAGAWHRLPLSLYAPARADWWRVAGDDDAEELRKLLEVLTRERRGGAVAWALDRFEMGCGRARPVHALSDHLLALRALLGDGAAGTRLSSRLAALCAAEPDRGALEQRVERASELERSAIEGRARDTDEASGGESAGQLAAELGEHLRALLRDVLCGYLDTDLRTLSDEIIAASQPPHEAGAESAEAPAAHPPREPAIWELDTAEFETIRVERLEPEPERPAARAGRFDREKKAARVDDAAPIGVTPSADWGFDEDAESYSAPV